MKNIDAAARDLGASDLQTLVRVIAPIMKPSLIAAFCLSATLSWDEFIIAFLLSRFDVTLPVIIFEMLRAGFDTRSECRRHRSFCDFLCRGDCSSGCRDVWSEENKLNNDQLVKLDHLSKNYDDVVAVDDVSLSIGEGELLVLLGPSGSGKTTILSMLGGFTKPSSGKVFIAGEDVTGVPPAYRPTVTVFQDYALFPHMSVRDNVGFGLAMRKVSKPERMKRVDESLGKVGLEGFGDRGVHQLSGGQRQRVALARAIAVEPAVLLLDEPLGALDLKIRQQMQTELVYLQKTLNATFVHVTHDQEEAMRIADSIALINHGRIEDYGSPERVYLRPSTLFSARFMGESNVIQGEIQGEQANRVSVVTGFGKFELPCESSINRVCNIILRPEQIRLGGPEVADGNFSLGKAEVTEIVFQGTHRLCKMKFSVHEVVDFLVRLPPEYGVSVGDSLVLHARESDAVLLPG